jgi:hypothetical protein
MRTSVIENAIVDGYRQEQAKAIMTNSIAGVTCKQILFTSCASKCIQMFVRVDDAHAKLLQVHNDESKTFASSTKLRC